MTTSSRTPIIKRLEWPTWSGSIDSVVSQKSVSFYTIFSLDTIYVKISNPSPFDTVRMVLGGVNTVTMDEIKHELVQWLRAGNRPGMEIVVN